MNKYQKIIESIVAESIEEFGFDIRSKYNDQLLDETFFHWLLDKADAGRNDYEKDYFDLKYGMLSKLLYIHGNIGSECKKWFAELYKKHYVDSKEKMIYPIDSKDIEIHKTVSMTGFYDYFEMDSDIIVPNLAFFWFCYINRLSEAENIYGLGDVTLDVCIYDTFDACCRKGNLEVVKWLFSLKYIENIGSYIHLCCIKEQRDVARWLFSSSGKSKKILRFFNG